MTDIKFSQLPPVSRDFILDFTTPVQVIGGPVGTGKTYTLALKILLAALSIVPDENGVRKTRFIVFRRHYGDLEASIFKDLGAIAPGLFKITGKKSPMMGVFDFPYTDAKGVGKRVHSEVYGYSADNQAELVKIKSLKFTAGAIVEAQENDDIRVYRRILERLGRFPTPSHVDDDADVEDNPALVWELPDGTTHRGFWLAMDINYPSTRHPLYRYLTLDNTPNAQGQRPRAFYQQPPVFTFVAGATTDLGAVGVDGTYKGEEGCFVRNPAAAVYIRHNGWAYYEKLLSESMGDDALIQQNLLAEFGDTAGGKPVYPRFRRERHQAKVEMKYAPGLPIYVGVDNSLNNAWVFTQMLPSGKLLVLDCIANVLDDACPVADALEHQIVPMMRNQLVYNEVIFYGDQAMFNREGGEGGTQAELLNKAGLTIRPARFKFTSDMRPLLSSMFANDMILINERCAILLDGLAGGFHYRINRTTGLYADTPVKNEFSHPCEALEIVASTLSASAGMQVRRRNRSKNKKTYNYF